MRCVDATTLVVDEIKTLEHHQPLKPSRAPPNQKKLVSSGGKCSSGIKRAYGESTFPTTPHPNQKFVREMIEWAKKKDTWGGTIRQSFRRRPQETLRALGFAWVCRRYFDVLGCVLGRG